MLISPLQKYEPKDWSGLTTENHLGMLYQLQPQLVSNVIEHIFGANLGGDIVSYINRFPTIYLNDDTDYEWLLQGSDEKNIPLVTYYNTDLSTQPTRPGIARSVFVLVFPDKEFQATEVLVGEKPDLYKLRVIEDPISLGGNRWGYKVQLVTGDDNLFIPASELAAGKRFSKAYGLVEQTLSKRGGGVSHTSPFRMRNNMSMIRKQYLVPGNMIRKGENNPLAFSWLNADGSTETRWINKLDYDFLTQFRREIARLLVYGNSNRMPDGTYGNYGDSGFEIRSGSGLLEQIAPSNIYYYGTFDIDWLTEVALGLSVGKLPEDQREFVLATGEYGMYQFHKEVQSKTTTYTPNFTQDRIYTTGDGKMGYKGMFLEYATVNGIKFRLVHDPMKDDPVWNKIYHPEGGLASSREYTLMDFGTSNGKPNIQKVAIRGDEEIFKYIPGLRDPYSPYNKTTAPGMAASPVDGYEVHRAFIGGLMVRNPMRLLRLIPNVLA